MEYRRGFVRIVGEGFSLVSHGRINLGGFWGLSIWLRLRYLDVSILWIFAWQYSFKQGWVRKSLSTFFQPGPGASAFGNQFFALSGSTSISISIRLLSCSKFFPTRCISCNDCFVRKYLLASATPAIQLPSQLVWRFVFKCNYLSDNNTYQNSIKAFGDNVMFPDINTCFRWIKMHVIWDVMADM